MNLDVLGYIGGTIATLSYLPQIIQSSRTKSVEDLSLVMLLMTLTGVGFWIAYGILAPSLPVVVTNVAYGSLVAYQLYLKLKYDRQ